MLCNVAEGFYQFYDTQEFQLKLQLTYTAVEKPE